MEAGTVIAPVRNQIVGIWQDWLQDTSFMEFRRTA